MDDALSNGLCRCYPGHACYADCTCDKCAPHRFVSLILGGARYFQVKDLHPDSPLLDRMVREPDSGTHASLRQHPEMLIARVDQ